MKTSLQLQEWGCVYFAPLEPPPPSLQVCIYTPAHAHKHLASFAIIRWQFDSALINAVENLIQNQRFEAKDTVTVVLPQTVDRDCHHHMTIMRKTKQ